MPEERGSGARRWTTGARAWLLWPLLIAGFGACQVLPAARVLLEIPGDFRAYHDAAWAWRVGQSPYEVGAFIYPPFFLEVVAPLASLPFEAARVAWLVISVLALLLAWWATFRLCGGDDVALVATAAVWIGAGTVRENLGLGQLNPVLLALLAVAMAAAARRPLLSAAALALATALKVWTGIGLLALVAARRWRALALAVVSLLVLSASAYWHLRATAPPPHGPASWTMLGGTPAPLNFSLPGFVLRLLDPPVGEVLPRAWVAGVDPSALRQEAWQSLVALGVAAAVGALLLAWAWRRLCAAAMSAPQWSLAALIALGIVVSPIAWYHYQLCQFPLLAMLTADALRRHSWRRLTAVGTLAVVLTYSHDWLFGRYVEAFGWTAEAPVLLWLSTSLVTFAGIGLFVLVVQTAADRAGGAPATGP